MSIPLSDLRVDVWTGGDTTVRVTHAGSGISATIADVRSRVERKCQEEVEFLLENGCCCVAREPSESGDGLATWRPCSPDLCERQDHRHTRGTT